MKNHNNEYHPKEFSGKVLTVIVAIIIVEAVILYCLFKSGYFG